MARGQRKSIEEKIAQKKEIINSLEVRLECERKELECLIVEQKQQEVDNLYSFIQTANLSVYEATDALQQYLSNRSVVNS